MAKYSLQSDMRDELIGQHSKRSDHIEAEEYVDKVLTKLGVDVDYVTVSPLLKELSITYATYKRAFYESKNKDDIFYQKYKDYERQLRDLTAELIRNELENTPEKDNDTI